MIADVFFNLVLDQFLGLSPTQTAFEYGPYGLWNFLSWKSRQLSLHSIGLTGFGGSGPSWCEGHPPCQLTSVASSFLVSAVGEVKCEGMIECN